MSKSILLSHLDFKIPTDCDFCLEWRFTHNEQEVSGIQIVMPYCYVNKYDLSEKEAIVESDMIVGNFNPIYESVHNYLRLAHSLKERYGARFRNFIVDDSHTYFLGDCGISINTKYEDFVRDNFDRSMVRTIIYSPSLPRYNAPTLGESKKRKGIFTQGSGMHNLRKRLDSLVDEIIQIKQETDNIMDSFSLTSTANNSKAYILSSDHEVKMVEKDWN